MTELSSFIHVYEDCFNGYPFIEQLEATIADQDNPISWMPSVVGMDRKVVEMRSSLVCNFTDVADIHGNKSEFMGVIDGIEKAIWKYRDHYDIPLTHNPGWLVNKYTTGAEYGLHMDVHQLEPRVISVVAMLNTVESGGELVFNIPDLSIPAKNGTVVIFPSGYPFSHASLPTISGKKYSLVSWLR